MYNCADRHISIVIMMIMKGYPDGGERELQSPSSVQQLSECRGRVQPPAEGEAFLLPQSQALQFL